MKIRVLLKSLLCSYVLTGIFLLLLAFLLYKMDLKESVVGMGIAAAYILSCFFGGFLMGKKTVSQKYLWGMLLGLCYFLLLIGVSWLSEQRLDMSIPHAATAFGMCLVGGTLGGMLA